MKPLTINNLELAKNQESLDGEIALTSFERLADLLSQEIDGKQKVRYKLTGSARALHLPSLHLSIEANLPVVCQRCLNTMQLELLLSYKYVISEAEPEPFDGDDEIDWLEASREMSVDALIEDELLIAVPLAPRHDSGCKPAKLESGEKHNPFAALKDLIK